jgi:hypothetical protein
LEDLSSAPTAGRSDQTEKIKFKMKILIAHYNSDTLSSSSSSCQSQSKDDNDNQLSISNFVKETIEDSKLLKQSCVVCVVNDEKEFEIELLNNCDCDCVIVDFKNVSLLDNVRKHFDSQRKRKTSSKKKNEKSDSNTIPFTCVIAEWATDDAVKRIECTETYKANMVTFSKDALREALQWLVEERKAIDNDGSGLSCHLCKKGSIGKGLTEDLLVRHSAFFHINAPQEQHFGQCQLCGKQCLNDRYDSLSVHLRNDHGPVSRGEEHPDHFEAPGL